MKIIKFITCEKTYHFFFYLFLKIVLSISLFYFIYWISGYKALNVGIGIYIIYGVLGIWYHKHKSYVWMGEILAYILWMISWFSLNEYLPLLQEGRELLVIKNISIWIFSSLLFTYYIGGKKLIFYYIIFTGIYVLFVFFKI